MAGEKPGDCLLVIFGASGDLTKRKLIPSLFHLFVEGRLPERFAVLGVSRSEMSDEAFRKRLFEFGKRYPADQWQAFADCLHYHAADSTQSDSFATIKTRVGALCKQYGTGDHVVYYLSMAPQLYEPTINQLAGHNMVTEGKSWCSLDRDNPSWQRVIIEKPFGYDPESAAHLNRVVGRVFEEENIYRIDHYLGKETVQNLLVFRFANTIFEPIWTREFIDHVQVTASESVGVEERGEYYDSPSGGAMRDMIQSHLLQVMAVVAMEPPVSMAADDIRVEKTKVLKACRTSQPAEIAQIAVRGQYGPGQVGGEAVPGYREEDGTDAQSQADTYAAMQVSIDTWRWGGVPFYLRSGKRMSKKLTEIAVTFQPTPHPLFRDRLTGQVGRPPNQMIINVQPDEGIRIRFEGKVPGSGMDIKSVVMDFDYVEQFAAELPEAYATLLLDAMRGDQTLFKHRDEIEHCWRIVQPVLDHWQQYPQDDLPNYAAGTWGPSTSDIMMARDGRQWHNP